MYVLIFYVPESHLEEVKEAVFAAGGGRLSGYEHCSWQVRGEGQFAPGEKSNPYLGKAGSLTRTPEYRVEIACRREVARPAVEALLQAHPYEVPAYHLISAATLEELG